MLILASLTQAAVAGALALALDSLTAILVLAALLGIGFAFAQPAEFALVPVIAGERKLADVNGFVEAARYTGMTAGPLIGGVLSATGGTAVAMAVNAVMFVVVALAAVLLRARRVPVRVEGPAGRERARDGAVFLLRDRTLGIVLPVIFVSLLFMSASITAEVFFLKESLDVGDAVYGVIFSMWTIGMVVGALVVARRVAGMALAAGTLIAVAVQGAGLGLPTVWLFVPFAGAMWLIGGLGHGTKNVLARTLIQERVPARACLRGVQRAAQRRRAVRSCRRRVARCRHRRPLDTRACGRRAVLAAAAAFALYRRRGEAEPVAAGEPARVPATRRCSRGAARAVAVTSRWAGGRPASRQRRRRPR